MRRPLRGRSSVSVRIASAVPPPTQTAWQAQRLVHGIPSRASALRPCSTQGHSNPVQPITKK
jgi:hypothetical protein